MKNKGTSEKLNGKDFMNIGIFTAINLVISIAVACTLGMIPMGFLLLTVVAPVFIGIPTMLFYTKIKKFGMILIYAVINGIIMVFTGMGAGALLCGVICSFFAELILKAGDYKSKNMCVIAYAVASLATAGNYLQWLHASDAWLQKKAGGYGEEYVSTISGYFGHAWLFPLLILLSFAGGMIGGMLGRAVLKKHFERSGLV